jgi:hypothetical protein
MPLTCSRTTDKRQKIKTDKSKTQKPRTIGVGAFGYTLLSNTVSWINTKWTATKEFDIDKEGDTTKWKIIYPLRNIREEKIQPNQIILPNNILETDIDS